MSYNLRIYTGKKTQSFKIMTYVRNSISLHLTSNDAQDINKNNHRGVKCKPTFSFTFLNH